MATSAPFAAPEAPAEPPAAPPRVRRSPAILLTVILVFVLAIAGYGGFLLYKRYTASKPPPPTPVETAQTPQPDEVPAAAPTPPDKPDSTVQPAPIQPPAPVVIKRPSAVLAAPPPVQPARGETPAPAPSSFATPEAAAPAEAAAPPQEQQPVAPSEPAPSVEQPATPPVRTDAPRTERAVPPATPSRPVYTGPPSGAILWSGQLQKNGLITIDGGRASAGSLRGELPGVPVMVEIQPSDVGLAEAPSPGNGWKRMVLRSRVSRQVVVTIRWTIQR